MSSRTFDPHSLRRRDALRAATAVLSPAFMRAATASERRAGGLYPKLLGSNVGAKNYDDPAYLDAMSKLDIVIVGFYPGWRGDRDGSKIRATVRELKRRNPAILVGQYTVLNECSDNRKASADDDKIDKLDDENWWLRTSAGAKTQWTAQYAAWDINITRWAPADRNGDRYPQWLARRDAQVYFKRVPEFDIWYFDNVMEHSRVKQADWRRDGRDVASKEPEIAKAYRQAQAEHWEAARQQAPQVVQMGNTDHDLSMSEYSGKLQGAYFEGMMGKSWSMETWAGWRRMMDRYLGVAAHLRNPKLIAFNVAGRPDDYRFFRYAFASCMLGDGYFSFSDDAKGYSSVAWFDEYDVRVGKPLEPPPRTPWMNGVYRRRYADAMVLVNPDTSQCMVRVESGWRRFKGAQSPTINDGKTGSELILPARDGLLLVKA
jgi:hypothetical protein